MHVFFVCEEGSRPVLDRGILREIRASSERVKAGPVAERPVSECCGDFKRNGSNIKIPTPNWPAGCEHMRFHEFQNAMGESALECPEVKAALRALIEEVKKMRTSIGGV